MTNPTPRGPGQDDEAPRAAAILSLVPMSGASISTVGGILASETVSATDPQVARIDELQFDLREGPCWDAIGSGQPVLEPDFARSPRRVWPAFSAAMRDEPVAALFAVPMIVGPFKVGAIDLYDVRPRPLEGDELSRTLDFAADAGRRVLRRAIRAAQPDLELEPPPHSRRVIHQATGFVIAQLGVPADEAELLISASAFAEGRPMREIADEIVARRRRFTTDGIQIEDGP